MWIEYEWSMWIVVQFFMFMARMASECDPGSAMRYKLSAGPLQGRSLVTLNHDINLQPSMCRAREFSFWRVSGR